MTGAQFDGVDLDLLADYVGGALTGTPDEERVAALVAVDPAWQAAYELLEPGMLAVGVALRDLAPEPMPADLAVRLDALFRDPATALSASPEPAAPTPDTSNPDTSNPDTSDPDTSDPDTSDPATPRTTVLEPVASEQAAPERAEAVPAKVVDLGKARRMRRWATPLAVAAAVVFAGFGVSQIVPPSSMKDSESRATSTNAGAAPMVAGPPAPDRVVRTGGDYTRASLTEAAVNETQIAGTFEASKPPAVEASKPPAVAGGEPGTPLERLSLPQALTACLEAIAQENSGGMISVEFVDYARFEGAPALIVRFSAANGIWVWAVGPECGTPGTGADPVEQLPVR